MLPISQLRRLYDALLGLYEQEQTTVAELHAADPKLLIHRFRESVRGTREGAPHRHPLLPRGENSPPVSADANRKDSENAPLREPAQ